MKESAGILIMCKNKVLLVHSTGSSWWKSYTPPKGGIEPNESQAVAASREVFEEVGILIDSNLLSEKIEIVYVDGKGNSYKTVHLFIHRISNYSEIGLKNENVPFEQMQHEEVDEGRFMTKDELASKILPRYYEKISKLLK